MKRLTGFYSLMISLFAIILLCSAPAFSLQSLHPVPGEHPRLLGSASYLKSLARQKPDAWRRVKYCAAELEPGEPLFDRQMKLISLGLVYVVEGDRAAGRQAVDRVMKIINAAIRSGHVTFGHDMAHCALVYDLCHDLWTSDERQKFFEYIGKTVDANVRSETGVFHNAWYGYKHWGYGLAAYATWYEYARAPEILAETERDYMERAAPALEISGAGGGFAEGYYVNYWSYEWFFFCEVARRVEGKDYFAEAPGFYGNRAVASMFESYPWISERGSRRPIPMGDSGGQKLRRERDKALSARRILVNYFKDDPTHQAVHAFNETQPVSASPGNGYKDLLWRDPGIRVGDLKNFKLSHFSPAAGYIYARSSWENDAVHFFFKCGDRFTAHQHLDNGHFLISKHDELAGDGGQYYHFGKNHDVNYHLRTIAHSTILVYDPDETWSNIRAYEQLFHGKMDNDGGQHHNWPHHNGATSDHKNWLRNADLYEIADIKAYEDRGQYLYLAGDCSRSYSPAKLEYFTRQIVYLRPGTFVIFDRVKSTDKNYPKTWQLQAAKPPVERDGMLVVDNGAGGRMFVQSLLPDQARVKLNTGDELYCYDGNCYPPEEIRGPAPECRIEVAPREPSQVDYFLHVIDAVDDKVDSVPSAMVEQTENGAVLTLGGIRITFTLSAVAGEIELQGKVLPLARAILMD
jgi:Heparinase II/III-like protein